MPDSSERLRARAVHCRGAALNAATAINAYTLSDRGTWLSYGHKTGMKIVLHGDHRL
jgi:tungstate transport system substrate-binding protein